MKYDNKYTANRDIRGYMADHCVSQKQLAESMGFSGYKINAMLKTELSQKDKENILHHVDAIVADRNCSGGGVLRWMSALKKQKCPRKVAPGKPAPGSRLETG